LATAYDDRAPWDTHTPRAGDARAVRDDRRIIGVLVVIGAVASAVIVVTAVVR
jgi:hypothetical protein